MEITELAEVLKSLTVSELTELNKLAKPLVVQPPTCPKGFIWSSAAGACVPDVG